MTTRISVLIALLTLAVQATDAGAEFVADALYRESVAVITDMQPPRDWTEDGDWSAGWGEAVTEATAIRDDSLAEARQATVAAWVGPAIEISGTMEGRVGRSGSAEQDEQWARNLVRLSFTSPEPFVLHVEYGRSGSAAGWIVELHDDQLGDGLARLVAGEPQGSATFLCAGTGSYTLEITGSLVEHFAAPGSSSGAVAFTVTLAPEGVIPVDRETWSGVKARFRW